MFSNWAVRVHMVFGAVLGTKGTREEVQVRALVIKNN